MAGDRLLDSRDLAQPEWTIFREYPLTSELLAVSHAWHRTTADAVIIASKGAPEAIADLCHLSPDQRAQLGTRSQTARITGLAGAGRGKGKLLIRHAAANPSAACA